MRVDRRLILAAVEAWVPSPPSAASAAGGWGKPVSRCVHRVEYGGYPAGDDWEVEELSVQVLVSARCPFDGGAPWRIFVTRSTSRSPEIGGFPRLRLHHGQIWERRIWIWVSRRCWLQIFAAVTAAAAVASSEAVRKTSRLLRGGLRRTKVWGAWAAARQRQLRLRLRRWVPEDFNVIFLFVLDLSVRSWI